MRWHWRHGTGHGIVISRCEVRVLGQQRAGRRRHEPHARGGRRVARVLFEVPRRMRLLSVRRGVGVRVGVRVVRRAGIDGKAVKMGIPRVGAVDERVLAPHETVRVVGALHGFGIEQDGIQNVAVEVRLLFTGRPLGSGGRAVGHGTRFSLESGEERCVSGMGRQ